MMVFPGVENHCSRRDPIHSRRITAVRAYGDWLEPLGVHLFNAFRSRAYHHQFVAGEVKEVPHCFSMVSGDMMCSAHRKLLQQALEPSAVYCCVKMYCRDLNLSQPPLKVISSPAVLQSTPRSVLAFQELSDKQISTYARLAELCEQKYSLPDAVTALKRLIVDRRYEVVPLTFFGAAFPAVCCTRRGACTAALFANILLAIHGRVQTLKKV